MCLKTTSVFVESGLGVCCEFDVNGVEGMWVNWRESDWKMDALFVSSTVY